MVSGTVWQERARGWLVQLRQERRAFYRGGQRDEPEGWRAWFAWWGAARVAGEGRQAFEAQHADRPVRARALVDGVSGMGLGYGRWRAGACLCEEVRIRDGSEWTYSPDDAEGGRECDVPYRYFDCVSAAAAWESGGSGADESAGGAIADFTGNYGGELFGTGAFVGRG